MRLCDDSVKVRTWMISPVLNDNSPCSLILSFVSRIHYTTNYHSSSSCATLPIVLCKFWVTILILNSATHIPLQLNLLNPACRSYSNLYSPGYSRKESLQRLTCGWVCMSFCYHRKTLEKRLTLPSPIIIEEDKTENCLCRTSYKGKDFRGIQLVWTWNPRRSLQPWRKWRNFWSGKSEEYTGDLINGS